MINLIYIDDEHEIDDDTKDILEMHLDDKIKEPYEIFIYKEGKKALEEIINFGNNSIIILDIRMPEMDGAEFLKQLRMKKNTFPVIGYSANKNSEDSNTLIKLLENDLFDYVKKNNHEDLIKAINLAIDKFKDNIPLELTTALNEYIENNPERKTSKIITKSGEEITFLMLADEINKKSKIGLDYEKALYKMSFEKLKRNEKSL